MSLKNVMNGGYCIGCGACTAVNNSPLEMIMNQQRQFEAKLMTESVTADSLLAASRVCPFSGESVSEDILAKELYASDAKHDPYLGYHLNTYTGFVKEGEFRSKGSSGGFGKWILYELLRLDLVDSVIQVESKAPVDAAGTVYTFSVFRKPDEVLNGSKSVYYPVEMSGALKFIRKNPGRYAITGIPCFIKAVRLLQKEESVFSDRIRFAIGVICGHLKSAFYADMLAWQMGVEPGGLASIDFRAKLPGTSAKEKGVCVESNDPEALVSGAEIVQNLFGSDYNQGFFQYKACDYCDDVVGETADISIGDAWLPEYIPDGQGTSLIIPRLPIFQKLMDQAVAEGRIHLETITKEQAIRSQAGGFRHRREGLSYRLSLAKNAHVWTPPKRIKPSTLFFNPTRQKIYSTRMAIQNLSFSAFGKAVSEKNFDLFRNAMMPLLTTYRQLYRLPLLKRLKRGIWRRLPVSIQELFS